ncbi:MAG: hypothetical protein H0V01_14820 [Bacteroidetes bacterium]|nr:hypothetical protein [Bacteroidota bacterium]HET6242956.1 hypothetical protein [Bacteroidia bacterium]
MKKILWTVIFLSFFSLVQAQEHEIIHNRITSEVWDKIAGIKHRVVDDYEYYPIFEEKLKALDGKVVTLKGYIVPIKEGVEHSSFLLSVLPINQCFYCGKNGIPMMVEVNTKKPVRYTENIVNVKGTLKLYNVNAAFACPVVLQQALVSE